MTDVTEIETTPRTEDRQPTGEIALCLSGGGYRAAAFHLGVMKSLEDLKLLDRVKFISTASGGTITAMKYAIDRSSGVPFDRYYPAMCNFLQKVNVVNEGFKAIRTSPSCDGKNDLSLIRCASNIYREQLIGKHAKTEKPWTVEQLLEEMKQRNTFRDLIFNSSEFRSGNNFRFRLSAVRNLVYGNRNTVIKPEVGRQVELADIIAATSCFPGVFEPMRFPDDFHFADRTQVQHPFRSNDYKFTSVSLMDGGILDNQGLYGMTVSYNSFPLPFDLLIVSDTSGREDVIYDFDLAARGSGPSLMTLLLLLGGLAFMILVSSIWLLYRTFAGDGSVLDTVATALVGVPVALLTASLLVGIIYGIGKIKSLMVMGYAFPIWQHLKGLTLRDLWTLGKGRVDSAMAMVFSVFMKRIRALQFRNTLDAVDADTGESLFNGITVFSIIYSIIPDKHGNGAMSFHKTLKPTQRMLDIAADAAKVGTKLWLASGELETLVACGRITICAQLLDYYWNNHRFDTLPTPDNPESEFHFVYLEWQKLLGEFA